jgi:hypothetical protein
MEYLMTYGWAILIVLAVIAILTYVVVIPRPEKCEISDPFICTAYTIDKGTGNLTLRLANTRPAAVSITIEGTMCSSEDGSKNATPTTMSKTIGPGDSADLYFNCATITSVTGRTGEVFVANVRVDYYPTDVGSGYPRVVVGTVGVKYR